MTNFKLFSNADLVLDTKRSVKEETKATLAVIERLREIAHRSVHLEIGYGSLHEFCVIELQYSDGAAFRRIHAMRLCDELPEAEEAISRGTLSLTNAASLQVHLKKDDKRYSSAEAKLELLEQVQGKSRRECERIFSPDQIGTAIHAIADDETLEDLKRLSELLAISPSDSSALIKKIARIARRAIDPTLKKTRQPKKTETASSAKLTRPARYTPAVIKKEVWLRDGSQCAFVDPLSKRRCWSKFGLQMDHIVPVSCGGLSTLENLRLLCFAHHDLVTKHVFGKEKVEAMIKAKTCELYAS